MQFFRKQRRTNSGLSCSDGASPNVTIRNETPRSRSTFSLTKTFSRQATNPADDSADDPKGPLGLNLLHSPSEPQIDLVFVHGLGGGSRKTWSKTQQRSHYWPQEWLSKDPAFKNVRIHSYGYDSDYLKGRNDCLNVHHFGKSFLGALSTSPCLAANSRTFIVALGHSMGGLVIKKAYILASQDETHKTLAGRFAAVYFLATPHRGADSASTLKNILRVSYDRAYVADLERNSTTVQVINDEFRHFSADLELWSFYETQTMKYFSSPIVDPESAILGYREERQIPMNADHRSICKFDSPSDVNYETVRNALASTVASIEARLPELQLRDKRDRNRDLKKYLDVSDVVEEDYLNAVEARMHDSCHWITQKSDYIRWGDGGAGGNRLLWIKGKPATGKSVLAGYVIDHLRESGQACSYFFFRYGDKSKSGLSRCLRSLAFQMARSDSEAGDAILELRDDGLRLDHVDERTLWRILFLSGIFQTEMKPHYWVIDALDECSNPAAFDSMLSSIDSSIPLRILVTSRDAADSLDHDPLDRNPGIVRSLSITTTDTLQDLRLLIETKTRGLGVVDSEDRGPLAEKILAKSKGSFLWTILVLKELARCHSTNEVNQVLEDVPRGMESMYKRTLESMSTAPRGKTLAKAILTWATCSVRPLTTAELNGALTIDIEDTFPRLAESVATVCGHLVFVDKLGKVQMLHETAREFLLSGSSNSEFIIDEMAAHTRMSQVCLMYLLGDEMKPPRNRRRSSAKQAVSTKRADFAAYAQAAYSYHLSKANPTATELFHLVEQFLKTNILTWIETVAASQNLNQLIRASKHFRTYANACAAERSPLDPRIRSLRQWTADLARIPAMFANALTFSPSSIYSLVAPFCPTSSMIYNAGRQIMGPKVVGALRESWDDRISCLDFPESQPVSLCYAEDFLAIGLASGIVKLFHATSYQEYQVLDHGEGIKFIAFLSRAGLMATCGMKMTKVWDIRCCDVVHVFHSPHRPLGMEFDGDSLLVASQKNYVASWDLQKLHPEPVLQYWSDTPGADRTPPRRTPCALAMSVSHGLLAVAYSGQPITLWDLEEDVYCGSCGKRNSTGKTSTHVVVALAFNPNPNIQLLAVAYLDGDLALLDPFSGEQLVCFRANCQTLAPSPNGRLLAAGGAGGMINVYEFDTLRVLYRVKSSDSYIKQLSFARDSLVLADIRGTQCTIWEPEALLRDSLSDESSGIVTSTAGLIVETVSLEARAKITSLAVNAKSETIFCGKDDGTVILHDLKTAACIRTVCSHKSAVRHLVWCSENESLLSVDASNRFSLHFISKSGLQDAGPVFNSQLESEKAIVAVLVGEALEKFIVSTRESDHLYCLKAGRHERMLECGGLTDTDRKWVAHPSLKEHALRIDGCTEVGVYRWEDLVQVKRFRLAWEPDPEHSLKCVTPAPLWGRGSRLVLEFSHRNGSSSSGIAVFDSTPIDASIEEESPNLAAELDNVTITDESQDPPSITPYSTRLTPFASTIAHVIGVDSSGRLVFLDKSSWVCSAPLFWTESENCDDDDSVTSVNRHFFVPYDWFAGRRDIVCALTQGDIAFTRGGDLAVVRGGLEYAEPVAFG
ncbi:hypothetical protein QBC34DRAFT_391684 [Podospora aff. communis PSN243]|uniref:GPI inositol-deacylase n=1 Tax=Podospora aff. communis PSN243 TaxID=3040156 RepID=A0AAV9H5G9_9PEZI|nr:hypothetical protein QBC34DRAFT_391684 [Podospora aff. communis PSN243]